MGMLKARDEAGCMCNSRETSAKTECKGVQGWDVGVEGTAKSSELRAVGSDVYGIGKSRGAVCSGIVCASWYGCCTLRPCRRQSGLVCLKGPGHTGQEAHQIQTFPKFSDLKGACQVDSYAVGLYRTEN